MHSDYTCGRNVIEPIKDGLVVSYPKPQPPAHLGVSTPAPPISARAAPNRPWRKAAGGDLARVRVSANEIALDHALRSFELVHT